VFSVSFDTLGLDARLLEAVVSAGFTTPTDIQREAIPRVLTGRDLMASAQTGTGKTAAFVLPALHRLLHETPPQGRGPRVLILTPTRELAQQVTEAIRRFGAALRLRSGSVVGGEAYGPQLRMLGAPLDLLVATPGRLIDHLERGRLDLSRVGLLVLDEADRMLDMGFIDDVQRIAEASPAARQTLLFSATLEGRISGVAARLLRQPDQVSISGVKEKHEHIEQRLHLADDLAHKHSLLGHLLTQPDLSQCVVFMATKRATESLARRLGDDGHQAAALHGDMPQRQRERTVVRMRQGQLRVLVATDVAARGLDIRGLSHVINFDLPMQAEDYVHRIGRTGRGGASGIAVSLVSPQERLLLSRIERLTGQRLAHSVIEGLEPRWQPERSAPGRGGGRRPGGRPGTGTGGHTRGAPRAEAGVNAGARGAPRPRQGGEGTTGFSPDRRPRETREGAVEAERLLAGFHQRMGYGERPARPAPEVGRPAGSGERPRQAWPRAGAGTGVRAGERPATRQGGRRDGGEGASRPRRG
jgi:superfamily II DNA/RNA helicase